MNLVPLVQVIAQELARVDTPDRRRSGKALPAAPLPRLRALGRDLDTALSLLPAVLDDEVPVLVRCLLDLTAVYQYLDGERGVATVERLVVDSADVHWRDVQAERDPKRQYATDGESRARGREHAAQTRRERPAPLPGISTNEAAALAGVSKTTVHEWVRTGRLPYTVHAAGHTRTVRRVRREDVVAIRNRRAAS